MDISLRDSNDLQFYMRINDDQYIDHKQLVGIIDVNIGKNFTIVDKEVIISNILLTYSLYEDLQMVFENSSIHFFT